MVFFQEAGVVAKFDSRQKSNLIKIVEISDTHVIPASSYVSILSLMIDCLQIRFDSDNLLFRKKGKTKVGEMLDGYVLAIFLKHEKYLDKIDLVQLGYNGLFSLHSQLPQK